MSLSYKRTIRLTGKGISNGPKLVTDGLVLRLDSANVKSYPGSGAAWGDLSQHANTGSIAGSSTFSANSINFGGVSHVGYTNNTLNGLTALSTEFTIACWVKYDVTSSYSAFFEKQTGTSSLQRLDLGHGTGSSYFTTYSGSVVNDGAVAYNITPGNWYNVVLTCTTGTKKGFINGALVLNTSFTSYFPDSTQTLGIGGVSRQLSGSIALVEVYNRALADREVKANYEWMRSHLALVNGASVAPTPTQRQR